MLILQQLFANVSKDLSSVRLDLLKVKMLLSILYKVRKYRKILVKYNVYFYIFTCENI